MFKIFILILFFAALISLFSGLFFLVKDKEKTNRLFKSLVTRVTFCVLLIIMIVYGFLSGELVTQAPWISQ